MRGPKLVKHPRICIVGLSFFGDPFETSAGWSEENEIGRLWKRWLALYGEHAHAIPACAPDAMLEVHIWGESATTTGEFDVFVGVEVAALAAVPVSLVAKVLPPSEYAIFTLEADEITGDWARDIYQGWMEEHGYRSAHDFMIQWYDQRFKGLDQLPGSELDIYIPVEKSGD